MPRMTKKRLDEKNPANNSSLKTSSLKRTHSASRRNKLKTNIGRLHDMKKTAHTSNDTTYRKLSSSTSTDSIIYVGSFKLNEKYSIIDLTESTSSDKSEVNFTDSKYSNCHTFYRNLFENRNLPCTASTSRLLDTLEGPKRLLKKNSKSASCLIVMNDKCINKIENSDVSNEKHSSNKRRYIHQITELGEEEQNIIRQSLEIEDDIVILRDVCNPNTVMAMDVPVETLMMTHHVSGNDSI